MYYRFPSLSSISTTKDYSLSDCFRLYVSSYPTRATILLYPKNPTRADQAALARASSASFRRPVTRKSPLTAGVYPTR